jgi:hypothetical protein
MKSCNSQDLVHRCIDWQILVQYVNNLKTRIYKAFLKKTRSRVHYLQSLCVNSPLAILAAANRHTWPLGLRINLLELAYLVFSLSQNFNLDTSFYCYYREKSVIKIVPFIDVLIEKTKLIVIAWCIEYCDANLLSQKGPWFYRPDNTFALNCLISKKTLNFKHVLSIDLNPCFNYFYLSGLIKRLFIARDIELYLLKWLQCGIFDYLAFCSNEFLSSILLASSTQGLFYKMANILTSFICSELNTVFYGLNTVDMQAKSIIFVCYEFRLLIFSQEFMALYALLKELRNFWLFNGIRLACASPINSMCLLNGTRNLLTIANYGLLGSFRLSFRPSLRAQFTLMKRVSFMCRYSASHPLFLLAIRLNKLLCVWSSIYLNNSTGKIFYLVDYLVCIRLRLFLRKQKVHLGDSSMKQFVLLGNEDDSRLVANKATDSIFAFIAAHNFYSQYASVKIFWIHSLKCLSN